MKGKVCEGKKHRKRRRDSKERDEEVKREEHGSKK